MCWTQPCSATAVQHKADGLQARDEQQQQRSGRPEGRTQHGRANEPAPPPPRAARASTTRCIASARISLLSYLSLASALDQIFHPPSRPSDGMLDASACWAGLVPYTADAQGSALLLCVSADGSEWGAFLGPHDGGEEARLRVAVAALCAGTQGLLAPAGSRADEAAAHLLSKLQAGKGVHRLATSSDEGVLFLTPTRRRLCTVSCRVPVRPPPSAARVGLALGSRSCHTLTYLTDAQGGASCREPPGMGPGGGASGRARRRRSRARVERRALPGALRSQRAAGAAAHRADQSRAGAAGDALFGS